MDLFALGVGSLLLLEKLGNPLLGRLLSLVTTPVKVSDNIGKRPPAVGVELILCQGDPVLFAGNVPRWKEALREEAVSRGLQHLPRTSVRSKRATTSNALPNNSQASSPPTCRPRQRGRPQAHRPVLCDHQRCSFSLTSFGIARVLVEFKWVNTPRRGCVALRGELERKFSRDRETSNFKSPPFSPSFYPHRELKVKAKTRRWKNPKRERSKVSLRCRSWIDLEAWRGVFPL